MASLVKRCPNCSTENDVSNLSCIICGKTLVSVAPSPRSGNQTSPPQPLQQGSFQSTASIRKPSWFNRIAVMGLIFIVIAGTLVFSAFHSASGKSGDGNSTPTASPHPTVTATLTPSSQALSEFKTSNGEVLGINDGSFAPFLLEEKDTQEFALKQQAATQLRQGNSSQAIALWQAALKRITNDAEALIYLGDQRVLLTGFPYVTLVAGTDLSNPSGLSDLQGIYVAQHEFNTNHHDYQLRILIANSGADTDNVPIIAQQIVQLAAQDKTVVGVISWLTSTENLGALPILAKAHIPIISPAASSDQLTGASPYFFRVVPPNQVQGNADALFAEQTLKAKKVVVFVDNQDSYSQNLAQDFEQQFIKDGNTVLKEEPFMTDHTSQIGSLIQDAESMNPDLLYFTSRDTTDSANFQDALPTSGPFARLPALAGDAGYVIHKSGFGRWYFIAFAFADEWTIVMGNSEPQPPFYQEYSADFNPNNIKHLGYYGYTRPLDISILSYDVTSVFEDAFHIAINTGKVIVTPNGLNGLTPQVVDIALSHITGSQAWQGVSGQISFDANHNPIKKPIVILSASSDGYTHMDGWEGCFAPGVRCMSD